MGTPLFPKLIFQVFKKRRSGLNKINEIGVSFFILF